MMLFGYEIEQLFLKAKGWQTEVLGVFIAPSGAVKRETFFFPTRDYQQALTQLANYLVRRGDVEKLGKTRLRIIQAERMVDDGKLKAHFVKAFQEAQDDME